MATEGKDYVVGKGKVYFDAFAPGTKTGTGERYIGNTPELTTSQDESTLDHFDADSGLNVKDESVTIEKTSTGSLVTDNVSVENVAMLFGADIDKLTIASATAVIDTFNDVKKGRWLQLGVTPTTPTGARNVTNVVVKKGSTTIVALNNYETDLPLGRVYIEPDAVGITELDDLTVTYDVTAGSRTVLIGKGSEVAGALRFVSANPVGSQKDYYWPYVKLKANGDFALKSDEWQQLPFSFEVLKKDTATERVYIDAR